MYNQLAIDYYNRGIACYKRNDLDSAIMNWDEAIRLQPDYIEALENRGVAYKHKGIIADALKSLNQAIHFRPDRPSLYYNRALVHVDTKDFVQAISDYTQSLTIDPTYPDAYCNRGILYLQLGEKEKAQSDLTAALQLNPNDMLARQFFFQLNPCESITSQALDEIQKNHLQEAWLLLQAAYDKDCKEKGAIHVGFGAIYESQMTIEKAFAAFDYAVSCDPSPQAYNNRGRINSIAGQMESAMADFEMTIHLQPENARAYFNLGGVCLQKGQFENALKHFTKALELGYPSARQAILNIQGQMASSNHQEAPNAATSPDTEFLPSLLMLSSFAYKNCGPHIRMVVVNQSSLFGLRTQKKYLTNKAWDVTIEELAEYDKSGFQGNRLGATLELQKPDNFLIRITTPTLGMYELSLWKKKKLEGIPQDAYLKQIDHVWSLQREMLAEKLSSLIRDGIIVRREGSLIYP